MRWVTLGHDPAGHSESSCFSILALRRIREDGLVACSVVYDDLEGVKTVFGGGLRATIMVECVLQLRVCLTVRVKRAETKVQRSGRFARLFFHRIKNESDVLYCYKY